MDGMSQKARSKAQTVWSMALITVVVFPLSIERFPLIVRILQNNRPSCFLQGGQDVYEVIIVYSPVDQTTASPMQMQDERVMVLVLLPLLKHFVFTYCFVIYSAVYITTYIIFVLRIMRNQSHIKTQAMVKVDNPKVRRLEIVKNRFEQFTQSVFCECEDEKLLHYTIIHYSMIESSLISHAIPKKFANIIYHYLI